MPRPRCGSAESSTRPGRVAAPHGAKVHPAAGHVLAIASRARRNLMDGQPCAGDGRRLHLNRGLLAERMLAAMDAAEAGVATSQGSNPPRCSRVRQRPPAVEDRIVRPRVEGFSRAAARAAPLLRIPARFMTWPATRPPAGAGDQKAGPGQAHGSLTLAPRDRRAQVLGGLDIAMNGDLRKGAPDVRGRGQ